MLFGGTPRYENAPLIGRGSPPPTVTLAAPLAGWGGGSPCQPQGFRLSGATPRDCWARIHCFVQPGGFTQLSVVLEPGSSAAPPLAAPPGWPITFLQRQRVKVSHLTHWKSQATAQKETRASLVFHRRTGPQ